MHPFFAPHFRKPAGLFGLYAARYMVKRNGFVHEAIEERAGFEKGQSVLEIGFGPGEGLRYYLDRHELRMDGIDFSPLMLRKAARRNRDRIEEGRLRLFLGDARGECPGLGCYDRVVFSNVLYFWEDLDGAFASVKRRVKPGGRLVFYMSNKSRLEKQALTADPVFNRYDSSEVLASLSRIGFKHAAADKIIDDSGDFLVVRAEA